MSTSKTSITRSEYLQLLGLRKLAESYTETLNQLVVIGQKITGELDSRGKPEYYGHLSDSIFGDRGIDEMLSLLELNVIDE